MITRNLFILAVSTVASSIVLAAVTSWGVASFSATLVSSRTMPSSVGPAGATGATGERGADGAAASVGDEVIAETPVRPSTGATGLNGERGLSGLRGEIGLAGVAGIDATIAPPLVATVANAAVIFDPGDNGRDGPNIEIGQWAHVAAGRYVYSVTGSSNVIVSGDTGGTLNSGGQVKCDAAFSASATLLDPGLGTIWNRVAPLAYADDKLAVSLIALSGSPQNISITCRSVSDSGIYVSIDFSALVISLTRVG